METIAEQVSEAQGNDGSKSVERYALARHPRMTRIPDGVRYDFKDGSSISTQGRYWDLSYPDCNCWRGAGHREDCPFEGERGMSGYAGDRSNRAVLDSDTGEYLGIASENLAHASDQAGPEGHVLAHAGSEPTDGWLHVPAHRRANIEREGIEVRRVYVEEYETQRGGHVGGYARDRYLSDDTDACPECGEHTADLEAHVEKFHVKDTHGHLGGQSETDTVVLPAFLASALINGDTSSLNDEDEKWLEAARKYIAPGEAIDVGEPYFAHRNDLPGFNLGADVAEYTILYHRGR